MAKKKNRGRDLHGLLVLDKPLGMSSNKALQQAKYLFNAKKAGHTGTLDPLATGVLVICFGKATKTAQHITNTSKIYSVSAKLGEVTDSGDREGQIIQQTEVTPNHIENLNAVVDQFIGEIDQVPPMYSAIKQNGTPLYKLARDGKQVPRAARKVCIHSLTVTKVDLPLIEFSVHCSKGTYIRALAEDIGRELGCGAHVTQLRRIAVGQFGQQIPLHTFEQLEQIMQQGGLSMLDRVILPIEKAFAHYPEVEIKNGLVQLAEQGAQLKLVEGLGQEFLRIYDTDHLFRGLGEMNSAGRLNFQGFYKH